MLEPLERTAFFLQSKSLVVHDTFNLCFVITVNLFCNLRIVPNSRSDSKHRYIVLKCVCLDGADAILKQSSAQRVPENSSSEFEETKI